MPKQKAFEVDKTALEGQITLVGFEDLKSCQAAILSSENAKALRDKKQALLLAIQTLIEQIKEQQTELDKLHQKDDVSVALETLLMQQTETTTLQEQVRKEQVEISVNLATQNQTKVAIEQLQIQLQIVEKDNLKWELLEKVYW